ncbi:hypothetical protein M9435_004773 [Picochlorum sp. BPE23]|nr:hypothetical protein M9435_004773 [Picochlorum sp. BPE23]
MFDITVFGATGYTGKRIAREIVLCGFNGTFALAGRNREKLEELKKALVDDGAQEADVGVIVADSNDGESLRDMTRSTKVLINAVGPFRFHGRLVVQACLETKTDYVDVCGEPEFMERIEFDFHDEASQKEVIIASAMGFDSVPTDIGNYIVSREFSPASCASVETFIQLHSGPSGLALHYPTYESAVHGFGSAQELRSLRKEAAKKRGSLPKPEFPLALKSPGTFDPEVGQYVIPFMGSCPSVIKRSQNTMYHGYKKEESSLSSFDSKVYMCVPTKKSFYQFAFFGTIFKNLARYQFGRSVLLSYPKIFSGGILTHQGPTEEQLKDTSFTVTCIGKGKQSHGKKVTLKIDGPEPGYVACSIFIVAAARILLTERESIKHPISGAHGGVFTPASLLMYNKTSYIDLLEKRGITCVLSVDCKNHCKESSHPQKDQNG